MTLLLGFSALIIMFLGAKAIGAKALPQRVVKVRRMHFLKQHGQAQPLHASIIQALQKKMQQRIQQLQAMPPGRMQAKLAHLQPRTVHAPNLYPIRSVLLTPGNIRPRRIHAHVSAPLFIIGDDARSKAWLQRHHRRLVKLHAKGFVVNVKTREALKKLRACFPKLKLVALPGNAFARWLHIKHYPVLITAQYMVQ